VGTGAVSGFVLEALVASGVNGIGIVEPVTVATESTATPNVIGGVGIVFKPATAAVAGFVLGVGTVQTVEVIGTAVLTFVTFAIVYRGRAWKDLTRGATTGITARAVKSQQNVEGIVEPIVTRGAHVEL
jgi:hypothetical protein